jgi:hypothetical protein
MNFSLIVAFLFHLNTKLIILIVLESLHFYLLLSTKLNLDIRLELGGQKLFLTMHVKNRAIID